MRPILNQKCSTVTLIQTRRRQKPAIFAGCTPALCAGEGKSRLNHSVEIIRYSYDGKANLTFIQCDRIKPCAACCLRRLPSECVYEDSSDHDESYISQADAIEKLRKELGDLQTRIARIEQEKRESDTHIQPARTNARQVGSHNASLEALFQILSSAPPEVVWQTVGHIREGNPLQAVITSARGSWTGNRHPAVKTGMGTASGGDGVNPSVTKRKAKKRVGPSTTQTAQRRIGHVPSAPSQMPLVLDILIGRFVAFLDPGDDPTGQALRALCCAADMRVHSPLLLNAYQAVSIVAMERSVPGSPLIRLGHQIYGNVLGLLQSALVHPRQSRSTETFVTVILLVAVEVRKEIPVNCLTH
jgi:hypothetical protein